MKRRTLPDGRWFDLDTAKSFDEDTYWNGHNHISVATGSQWDHECLYRTASGLWVLEQTSAYQHVQDMYMQIDNDAAARWLVRNGHKPHPACAEEYAALEL